MQDLEPGDVVVAVPTHLQEQQPYNDNSLSDKAWEVLRATVPETALRMYEEKALEKIHQDKMMKAKEVFSILLDSI